MVIINIYAVIHIHFFDIENNTIFFNTFFTIFFKLMQYFRLK